MMFNRIKSTMLSTVILLLSMIITQNFSFSNNKTMGFEEVPENEIVSSEIAVVEEEVEELPNEIGTGSFITPLEGTFTSGYGQRWGRLHGGIDIAATEGTPIYASDNGTVIFAENCGTYGLLIKLDHGNGYITYYAHCSKIIKNIGDKVSKGDEIALVGNTGNSTGPHCHFEIRYNNERKNPLEYVSI